MALGLLAMSLLPDHPTMLDIAWRMTVCGIGFGFFNTPNNRAIITSAPPIRTGGASGMQATARLLGQSMGAALVALVFTAFPLNGTTVALFIAAGRRRRWRPASVSAGWRRLTLRPQHVEELRRSDQAQPLDPSSG